MVVDPGLTAPSWVKIVVFTSGFSKAVKVEYAMVPAGGTVTLDLVNQTGKTLANGLYYIVVTSQQGRKVVKLLVLR